MTWKRTFPRRFIVEYTWSVCRAYYVNNYLLRTTEIIYQKRNTGMKRGSENGININFYARDLLCLTFTIYSTSDFLCPSVDAYKYKLRRLLGKNALANIMGN